MKILGWISNPAHSFGTPLKKWVNMPGAFTEPGGSRRVTWFSDRKEGNSTNAWLSRGKGRVYFSMG